MSARAVMGRPREGPGPTGADLAHAIDEKLDESDGD